MSIDKLSPEELALLTNIIAIEICRDRSSDEINRLAAIYSSIVAQMVLISEQRDYIENKKSPTNENPSIVSTETIKRKSKKNMNNKGIRGE